MSSQELGKAKENWWRSWKSIPVMKTPEDNHTLSCVCLSLMLMHFLLFSSSWPILKISLRLSCSLYPPPVFSFSCHITFTDAQPKNILMYEPHTHVFVCILLGTLLHTQVEYRQTMSDREIIEKHWRRKDQMNKIFPPENTFSTSPATPSEKNIFFRDSPRNGARHRRWSWSIHL